MRSTTRVDPHTFVLLLAIGGVVLLGSVRAQGQPANFEEGTVIRVGGTNVRIMERIVVPHTIIFHRSPSRVRASSCVVKLTKDNPGAKLCPPISAGRVLGVLGCFPAAHLPAESITQTFARVPGSDTPNLVASVVGLQLSSKRTEGKLLVAVMACGSWVAIPVAQEDEVRDNSEGIRNRISLSFEAGKDNAQVAFWGSPTRPDSYRIAGSESEAVLFVVPFRSLKALNIVKSPDGKTAQTRGVQFVDGEYYMEAYSATDGNRATTVSRDVVPAGHPSVPVILNRH